MASEDLDLPEIQSLDPEVIIREKLRVAQSMRPDATLFVEDVSFWIGDLGFPGPLIKFMIKSVGVDGVSRFAQAFGADTAKAICTVGYVAPGTEPMFFSGEVNGSLVPARKESGFGFDPIFVPEGETMTYAEMGDRKNEDSHRARALKRLADYLANKPAPR